MIVRMRRLNGLFMTIVLALSFFVVSLALANPAMAQAGGAFAPRGKAHIHAALIAESQQPAPGSTVTLAIRMQPDKGWHGYWKNPGDAGLGMTIDWALPTGVQVGDLRYPVPQRLVISGLMNHVYEHEYTLLFDVIVPKDVARGTVLPIHGMGHWLACTHSICVPEQGELSTTLTVGDGTVSPAQRARFDGFRAALPRPLDQQAHYAIKGDRIAIAVPYPAGAPVGDPWFFALSKGRIVYAQPQTARRSGNALIIETKLQDSAPKTGEIAGVLAVSPHVALKIKATPGVVPAGGTPIGPAASGRSDAPASLGMTAFLLVLGAAFLGGLILNIMPCVFPILSLKAISLAKAGGAEKTVRGDALAYTAGILLTCLGLGALMLALRAGGAQIGWAFQLQDPRVIAVLLLLVVAITLNLAGLFEIGTLAIGQGRAAQGGRVGAFWTGALAAFIATPCTGPFMGAAMGAALVLPWPLAFSVFGGLGLGLASPFLAIAWVPALRRMMPRPGNWMNLFRKIMAVPMALTALALLWLLWRQLGTDGIALGLGLTVLATLALVLFGRTQRAGRGVNWALGGVVLLLFGTAAIGAPTFIGVGAGPVAGAQLAGLPFNADKLASLRAADKPVFLYFTADWCLTCKVNEANAIDRTEVGKAFAKAGVTMMVGDWTRADPAITRFLAANGRSGVPLYLYYAPGAAKPRILPQILTPGLLTGLAKS